jgi:hypothetical protein
VAFASRSHLEKHPMSPNRIEDKADVLGGVGFEKVEGAQEGHHRLRTLCLARHMAMLVLEVSPEVLNGRYLVETGYARGYAPPSYIARTFIIIIMGPLPFPLPIHTTGSPAHL